MKYADLTDEERENLRMLTLHPGYGVLNRIFDEIRGESVTATLAAEWDNAQRRAIYAIDAHKCLRKIELMIENLIKPKKKES